MTISEEVIASFRRQLDNSLLSVQRLRGEHRDLTEVSSSLLTTCLGLEHELEDKRTRHQLLLGTGGKQINPGKYDPQQASMSDLKGLKDQFRHGQQKVQELEMQVKEAEGRRMEQGLAQESLTENQNLLGTLAFLLTSNLDKLKNEQTELARVVEATTLQNNKLHGRGVKLCRQWEKLEQEVRVLEEEYWQQSLDVIKSSHSASGEDNFNDEDKENEEEEEEGRLKERLIERTEELASIRSVMETTLGIAHDLDDIFDGEEGKVQLIQKQLREVQDCWEDEKDCWERELEKTNLKLKSLIKEGQEKAEFLGIELDFLKRT